MIFKKNILFVFLTFLGINGFAQQNPRKVTLLEQNWKFVNEDIPEAKMAEYDASKWRTVSLPHDWAFENGITKNGSQSDGGGYYGGGIGWYRYQFEAPKNFDSQLTTIEFDGVYMNSEVWINGRYLGKRPYGYISFRYELSKYLKTGKNVIALRVDNSKEPSARWYHACGIYAPVYLISTSTTFIEPNGVHVTTQRKKDKSETVRVKTSIKSYKNANQNLVLETSIIDASGKLVIKKEQPIIFNAEGSKIITNVNIQAPKLWDPKSPYLYHVTSEIKNNNKVVIDAINTKFGVRTIKWDTKTGFWLNGKQTKLLGVCEHYEGGPIGGAWTEPLLRWKLGLLKEMGVNAIRTAHNPTPPMFYNLCDEMGIMVMDEIFDGWSKKAPEDYGKQAFSDWWRKDIQEWITRDRNHPSVIIYSLGNETRGNIAKELVAYCHQLDSTRLVTSGHSESEEMDVYGVNGNSEKMDFLIKPRLNIPFIATEAPHTWQTRGYYRSLTWFRDEYKNDGLTSFPLPDLTDKEIFTYEWAPQTSWSNYKQHFNSSYDNATVRISARKGWEVLRDSAWYSGSFRWTGFDYFGEAGYVHGGWPFRLFMSGALDVAGFKKDLFYFYQSQWTKKPMVHILPSWTHPKMEIGTKIPVWVYSNCDEVELFLNGKSLGKDKPGKKWNEMQCEWLVPYEKGTLIAVGYLNGRKVVETSQVTAGTPATLSLTLDDKYVSPKKDNIAVVTVSINDDKGICYPYGENKLFYNIQGPARFLTLENGDPVDTTAKFGVFENKGFMGLSNAFIKLDRSDQPVTLTTGAILGEKQLMTSNKIAIDVKSLVLRGKPTVNSFKVYYTIDGSSPTPQSTLYTRTFEIKLGTTVKAIVVKDSKVILNMQENFDGNLGLYWLDNTAKSSNGSFIKGMKAINAEYKGAQKVTINNQSSLRFDKEGYIRWYQENDGSEGMFDLVFYLESINDNDNTNCLSLIINNTKVDQFNAKINESGVDGWKVIIIKHKLQAGANDIILQSKSGCNAGVYLLNVN
ncbi:Beta-galactosidase [Arcticibacter svalbardensis MN12-7]|uniref:Beta-galactosidase n=1 Tax=Arcticibacter svalbardensis MN12-7 TaxID=1150600 RepID=R9GPF8_9SPHI|nr:glycoside hydrolase family 2 TIM barrel-domain containing protein [Arcticibacter svalbardensis]EOR93430.1 Beta-galactosidase [Arcticibacter svalbardensis MN12-7]